MNAKRRTLAVLAAVIAVLGLALWALNRSTAAEEAASSAADPATRSARRWLRPAIRAESILNISSSHSSSAVSIPACGAL